MTELVRPQLDALSLRAEPDADPDAPNVGRSVRLRIVPWGVVAQTPDSGPETFARGAFDDVDPERVTIEAGAHGGPLVGRGTSLEQLDDAAYLDAIIARTTAGDELLELARAGVYRDVSVAFAPVDGGSRRRRDGAIERTRADLRRVAILERGAYAGAQLVHIREGAPMTTDLAPVPTLDEISAAVRGIVLDAIPAPIVEVPSPTEPTGPAAILNRASSFADLYERVLAGDHELVRAMADQISSLTPEVVRPAWLTTILGILPASRPAVSAFGRDPLPDDGMVVYWPTFDGAGDDSSLRVAPQSAEKADIISKTITLDSSSTNIVTYAGGLDISWQTLRRSSPSFREIALRILTTAWAQVTDKAFGAALWAGGTTGPVIPITATGLEVHAALVEASAMVDDATGAPASAVLAAPDVWLQLAGAAGLGVGPYGVQNVPGTVAASTLNVSISGLTITRDRNLAPGQIIVSNDLAASWLEDGMFTAEQDVVAKLGTDVAVWSLGASALYIPAGIVKVTISATAARQASSSKS